MSDQLPLASDAFKLSKSISDAEAKKKMELFDKKQQKIHRINSTACSQQIEKTIQSGSFWAWGAECKGKGMSFSHAFGSEFERELIDKEYSIKCEVDYNFECNLWKIYYDNRLKKNKPK